MLRGCDGSWREGGVAVRTGYQPIRSLAFSASRGVQSFRFPTHS